MKLGFIYRLYKEGKLNLTKEQMNELWKNAECLNYRNVDDLRIIRDYQNYIFPMLEGTYKDDVFHLTKEENFKKAEEALQRYANTLIKGYRPDFLA